MTNRTFLTTATAACFAVLALASCRPEEQGRPLHYEPGVYLGKPDTTALSEEALAELRQRSLMQTGVTVDGAQGATVGTSGSDVRPPAAHAQ